MLPIMRSPLQQNTLGNGVTLGNPEAQSQYQQLAQAIADQQRAQQMQQLGGSLMTPEYAQNSGLLGSLAMVAQAYAGKKLSGKASEDEASARERYYKGEAAIKDAEAQREAERKRAADAAERAQREADAKKYGLEGRDATRYVLEGNIGELPSITPLATDQGYIGVRRDGTYQPLTPAGAQNVQIAGDVPEQVRQAIMADPQAWENGNSIDIRQPQRPLMPYKDPAIAQRQAARDGRDERRIAIAEQAAEDARKAREEAAAVRTQAAQSRQMEAADTAQGLVDAIDRLTGQSGFSDLGTTRGDIEQMIPFVRTDAKDAAGTLENIGGQVALTTMARLKALSAQGATGFGALNREELRLLQNAITSIDQGKLSNEQLTQNLAIIREKMAKVAAASRQSTAPALPQNEPQQSNRIRIKI